MRFCRVFVHGEPRWAEWISLGGRLRLWTNAPYLGGTATEETVDAASASFLAPAAPSKILCVGRNYRAHAQELGNEVPKEPLLFLKPASALLGPGATVRLPPESQRVEHEAELAVVIGKRLTRVTRAQALEGVFGLTCANDVTARDLQRQDVQFTRAKGFDTFCPCGPWITTGLDAEAPREITLSVNGETRQRGTTGDMVWNVGALVAAMSCTMTLEPGDLVLTGTPAGVGPLAAGDQVVVEISGVGRLEHGVATLG